MDVDIDLLNRKELLSKIDHIAASRVSENSLVPHNTGVYFQNIPHDAKTKLSSIEYKSANSRGYFKIDFLNVHVYQGIETEQELVQLMNKEPCWELFDYKEIVDSLFQLNGHFYELQLMKPRTIEQLSAFIAMIRPAKRYLIGKSWSEIFKEIWIKPDDGYYFKKAHALSYAMAIVVQMNKLKSISLGV